MICKKCGSEIKEGVAFCTNCGARIEEEAAAAESGMSTNPVQNARAEQAKTIWGDILYMIKNSFKKPVTMLREFADEKYFMSGIVFLAGKDILTALLIAITIASQMSMLIGGYGAFVNEFSGVNSFSSFLSIFPLVLVVLLLCDAAGALLTYAAGKIFGTTISLKKWIGAYSYASVWCLYSGICGSLMALIRIPVMSSIITLLCMLVFTCVIVKAFELVLEMKGDKLVYAFLVGGVFVTIAVTVIAMTVGASVAMSFANHFRNGMLDFMG